MVKAIVAHRLLKHPPPEPPIVHPRQSIALELAPDRGERLICVKRGFETLVILRWSLELLVFPLGDLITTALFKSGRFIF